MSDQIKMLIDSMQRLLSLLCSNRQNQIEIYKTLTKDDLLRIIAKIDDENAILRKMSLKLICELLFQNNSLKEQFGDLIGIRPINGHIIINKIPHILTKKPERLLEIMSLLKSSKQIFPISSKSMCWYIDPMESQLSIGLIKLEDNQIVDPRDYVIGITTLSESNSRKAIHESVVMELRSNLKQYRPRTSLPYAITDRDPQGLREIRTKREDPTHITLDQSKINPRLPTKKPEQRVKTDDFDHLRPRVSKGGINVSPQPYNLRGVDKTLREKKNQRSGIGLTQSGNMSDRSVKSSQFQSKVRASNNFVSEIRNNLLAAKDSNSSKKTKHKAEPLSHRQSFDGNYKPSEIFLKRFRGNAETDRRLY